MNRRFLFAAALLSQALLPIAAHAATIIDVTLWDKGAEAEMMSGMPYDASAAMQHKMANMGIKLSRDRVPAGDVAFKVANGSKDIVHEMIVVPLAAGEKSLPYDQANGAVDEEAAGHLGEVSELDPGKTGSLTLNLKPGTYLVLCNVPLHYSAGMWQVLTVTR